jgi:Ca2+-binding EF-hand superfamily protein
MPPAIVTIGRRILADMEARFDSLDTDEDDEIELNELFRLYSTGGSPIRQTRANTCLMN